LRKPAMKIRGVCKSITRDIHGANALVNIY